MKDRKDFHTILNKTKVINVKMFKQNLMKKGKISNVHLMDQVT